MSRQSEINRYLLRHPTALVRTAATGRPPTTEAIDSPLIRFLEAMPPRERLQWTGIRSLRDLGYDAIIPFRNAEQLLRWLKPKDFLVAHESTPAEERKIRSFAGPVTRVMFAAVCAGHPPPASSRVSG